MKRILDAHGNIVSTFHYDEMTDMSYVHTHQDVEPIVNRNEIRRTDGTNGYTPSRELRHVAEIGLNQYLSFIHGLGLTWNQYHQLPKHERSKHLRRWLNDLDFRKLRSVDKL